MINLKGKIKLDYVSRYISLIIRANLVAGPKFLIINYFNTLSIFRLTHDLSLVLMISYEFDGIFYL